jgi:uncharacterized damage-inducible protein DinB
MTVPRAPARRGGRAESVPMDRIGPPDRALVDPKQVLLGFLDRYRSVVVAKVAGLSDADLRTSRLPSGWTPAELLNHLAHMERRWLRWGFLAEPTAEPFADADEHGRWHVPPDRGVEDLVAALEAAGRDTRAIAEAARLEDVARAGGRFPARGRPPTLAWTLAYVLQEYARHAGHLDVARELADGATGE